MSAHRRRFLLQAGVVGTLAIGAVLLPALPAQAAAEVRIQNIGDVTLSVGGAAQTLTIRLNNAGDERSDQATLTVNVGLAEVKVGQASGCNQPNGNIIVCQVSELNPRQTQQFSIPLAPPANGGPQPGAQIQGDGGAALSSGGDENFKVTLRGPSASQTVTEVSGTVTDSSSGSGVSGALVLLQDSARHEYTTTTDGRGNYRFTGSGDKPITPGTLTLAANKEGFDSNTLTKDGQAGRSVTGVRIALKAAGSAAPSAPASDPAASASPSTNDIATPNNSSNESSTDWLSWLLIGLGILLVLLGIGAMVVLLIRRKKDREAAAEDEYGQPQPTQVGAGAVPAGHGMYRGAEATMVARPGMDDPTAIVPPATAQLDEYPDPYAAVPSRAGYGYGGAAAGGLAGVAGGAGAGHGGEPGYPGGGGYRDERGYGGGDTRAYNGDRGYGDQRGYPAERGGYPAEERFPAQDPYPADERRGGRYGADEPTGRFAGGYPTAGGHGAENAGYGGYGPGGDPGAGSHSHGRRHAAEPDDGPYGDPRGGGYPAPGGYDRPQAGGYDRPQAGGYDRPQSGGYDRPQAGGYDPGPDPRHDMYDRAPSRGGPPPDSRGRTVDWRD